ncbi:DNA helicase PriA [Pseudotenacibaculum sp. MALMAid0570]|uniref:DNA helicase PriA n=1 Tax=Pseudotenacibaculum sp. MALMAid0570 TaxID=3143938 RepID=UPI0032DF5464
MEENLEKEIEVGKFACTNCGSDLKYKPGTHSLACEHCGTTNEIPEIDSDFEELDFHQYLADKSNSEETFTERFVKCHSCGATSSLESHITSASCPYCSTALVIDESKQETIIKPKALLPFHIDKVTAKGLFKKWVSKLWFAPNDLKKASLSFDHFKGIYIPYWTYDTDTFTKYVGQRGIHYYVTESYTTTENGKSVTRTRQVQRTRWYPASGSVNKFFDDVLVTANQSLSRKYIYKLEPWDLENLIPFEKSYLSGFITEKYQIDLEQGFDVAKDIMDPRIRSLIRRDIGGDVQRIISMKTNYDEITFKHLLLPVYVSAYRYKDKLYQFLVNGRTGEIQGQRPYSWVKITLAVLLGLGIVALVIFLAKGS